MVDAYKKMAPDNGGHIRSLSHKELTLDQCLDDTGQLIGDTYLLRTLRQALLAVLTLLGPCSLVGQGLLIAIDKALLTLGIVGCPNGRKRQDVLVDSFVVVGEVSRNINAIRARHAILAGGTGDGGEARHLVGNRGEQRILRLGTRIEGREGVDVLLKMVHAVHTAEDGEYIGVGAHPAECPACRAVVGMNGLKLI